MKLDARITLISQPETIGSDGSPGAESDTLAEVFAKVENVRASEEARAATRTMKFTIRHSPTVAELQPRDAIEWRSEHYAMESITAMPPERPQYLEIIATTSADSLPE